MRRKRSPMRTLVAALAMSLVVAASTGCKKMPFRAPEVKDVVEVTVDGSGFHPDRIPAKRGRPITLVFKRTVEKTCADEVVIVSERIDKKLPLNQDVIVSLIPEKVGEMKFACPMNMVTGTIDV